MMNNEILTSSLVPGVTCHRYIMYPGMQSIDERAESQPNACDHHGYSQSKYLTGLHCIMLKKNTPYRNIKINQHMKKIVISSLILTMHMQGVVNTQQNFHHAIGQYPIISLIPSQKRFTPNAQETETHSKNIKNSRQNPDTAYESRIWNTYMPP